MKLYAILFSSLLLIISCKPRTAETTDQQIRTENFELKKENDSLRSLIAKSSRTFEGDTIQKLPEVPEENSYPAFPGRHALTLQWIGWQKPGSVTITAIDDTWYSIQGSQTDENGNYLKINGRIRPLNNRELEFDGKIESLVESINNGEPCIRSGKKLFKATGTRKYWRLQDMINCGGGMITDYVDIYF